MSTQQDIYAAGSENSPPMLNKDNYVPWSSRIIRYARSRPNGKMIVDSIENGPYIRRMIATPEEPDLPVQVPETFHEQTDEELTKNDIKRMDADDQAIQTILLGLPKDVYAAVDSCETVKEIWERVRQMMKGLDIEEQEKKAKLFNEWEKFTSTDGESIESYYHLRQTKNLHEADFTQIYDFLKMNQDEYNPQPSLNQNFMQPPITSLEDINDPTEAMNAARILFAKVFQLTTPTNNNQRTSSNPRNRQIAQPGMNMSQDRQSQNIGGNDGNQFGQYTRQVAQNQQGYNAWQNGGIQVAQNAVQNPSVQNGGNQNRLVVVPVIANQNGTANIVAARAEGTRNGNQVRCYNCRGLGHIARNCTARPRRRDAAYLQTQLLIAQKEEAGIQLQSEEFDFMAAAGDLDEIEEVNTNCILMENLQHASTSGTQLDKAPIYDTDSSDEVQLNDNCHDNDIFDMFTQEEQYTDLLEPIPEPQLVPQNDNHVTYVAPSMVQSGGTLETSSAPNEKTRAHQETVYHNLIDQVTQISYDKAYNDVQQKIELLQAQLGDLKGKSSDTPSASNTLDPLNQKLESKIVELEFQVVNYEREIRHLKTLTRIWTSVTPQVNKPKLIAVTPYPKKLHALIPSHSIPQPREFNIVKHSNRHVTFKENVSSNTVNSSSTGFDLKGKLVTSKETNCPNDDKACPSNPQEPIRKRFPNSTVFLGRLSIFVCGTVRFGNDHIAAILGYGVLKWGNIIITRVYFVEGLGHNLFSVGQFCDASLEVTFRRNYCFIRDLDGVDLLKGNRSINLYTINLYDMVSASPICLMARASPTKSWLWHQRLSHHNFDTINNLAKNDLVSFTKVQTTTLDILGFIFSEQRMKHQKNRTLVEAAKTMLIFSHALLFLWAKVIATACYTQNRSIIHQRFNKTPYELIQGKKPDISYLYVFGALCYPKNDREDIGKLDAKDDIGFFIGYSANSVAYRVYNRRTKKIMETMNVTFDELSAMAFEQNSSKPDL
nr:integrase, catalytic region, zinc finger, CCHC-type, peptidase aspartic, catalytic [Tanacetum cinerariifolium]